MPFALIMATENTYFKYGAQCLAHLISDYKLLEFNEINSFEEISRNYRDAYIVCDCKNHSLYTLLFSGGSVKCIHQGNIILNEDKFFLSTDDLQLPKQLLRSFNDVEKNILFLYFIKRKKVKEIAAITKIAVSNIYYRIRTIKIKLGAETSQKLPIVFKDYF